MSATPEDTSKNSSNSRQIQVFCDVDDTIMAAGPGVTIAGCDASLPKYYCYPGVGSFLFAIAQGRSEMPPEGVILLSARPDSKLSTIGDDNPAVRALASGSKKTYLKDVLYGRKRDVVHSMKRSMFTNFAKRKVRNLREYGTGAIGNTTAQGCDFAFIGDNGQGDALAAQIMLSEGLIEFAFIHVVTDTPILKIPPQRNLFMFDNYATAARVSLLLDLITNENYETILSDVTADSHDFCVDEEMVQHALDIQQGEQKSELNKVQDEDTLVEISDGAGVQNPQTPSDSEGRVAIPQQISGGGQPDKQNLVPHQRERKRDRLRRKLRIHRK